jgi:hypothetical protein
VKRKDLTEWESDYGGTTAEGIAKRVINQYSPSSEELSRTVSNGRASRKSFEDFASDLSDCSSLRSSDALSDNSTPISISSVECSCRGISISCFSVVSCCHERVSCCVFAESVSRLSVPKSWKSASSLFFLSIREKLKAENPGLTAKEISALQSSQWEALTTEDKKKWQNKSDEDKKRWISQTEEYQKASRVVDDDFPNSALHLVLGKCFDAEGLDQFIVKCCEKDSVAFVSLGKTKSKTKKERLKLTCTCRPPGCGNAADLLRYFVEVFHFSFLRNSFSKQ